MCCSGNMTRILLLKRSNFKYKTHLKTCMHPTTAAQLLQTVYERLKNQLLYSELLLGKSGKAGSSIFSLANMIGMYKEVAGTSERMCPHLLLTLLLCDTSRYKSSRCISVQSCR